MKELEDHLKGCRSCRQYFDTMSDALLPGETLQRGLVPDPYMPVRIQALAKELSSTLPSGKDIVVRWSLRAVTFAAAVVLGVYMGDKLANQPLVVTDQYIISEYSSYLGENGIGERWQTVALAGEAVSK